VQVNYLVAGVVVVENRVRLSRLRPADAAGGDVEDIAVVEAGTLVAVLIAMTTQLVGDLAYMLLDPRIRVNRCGRASRKWVPRRLPGAPDASSGNRETVRKRTIETSDELTPHEARIARMARDGAFQPGHRDRAVRQSQDGRIPPAQGLLEARDQQPAKQLEYVLRGPERAASR